MIKAFIWIFFIWAVTLIFWSLDKYGVVLGIDPMSWSPLAWVTNSVLIVLLIIGLNLLIEYYSERWDKRWKKKISEDKKEGKKEGVVG
jgi:hypothetical protein